MDKINYDVLIPARDEENNIKKTLECITNQTIKPNSIIVINDNSKDETEKIATSYGVKVINFPYEHKNWVTSGELGILFSFGMNFFNIVKIKLMIELFKWITA
jgi:glycosyltransferase involved in cell wall biosynthesis